MSMLWVDKYRPKDFSALDYHIEQARQLKNLVTTNNFPHLLIYGPSGAGKKTRIMCLLRELFGSGVEKLRMENVTVTTPSNKKVEITTVNSNYHIEVNPSDVGIYDRVVIMELIKNIAQSHQIATTSNQRTFKVVVLSEVDNLTKDAQHALRRTMEKYSSNCRLILCTSSLSPIIPAIKSRCLPIRILAPSVEEISKILLQVSQKEGYNLPDSGAERIANSSGGNLRRALLICEACKAENVDFKTKKQIEEPDWKLFIMKTGKYIVQQQNLQNIMRVRANLYELLTSGIPPNLIFKHLVEELLIQCDKDIIPEVASQAALYEHRMTQGNKHIVHLEAFVIKFMCLHQNRLKQLTEGL